MVHLGSSLQFPKSREEFGYIGGIEPACELMGASLNLSVAQSLTGYLHGFGFQSLGACFTLI